MPVQSCQRDGRPGYRWGRQGRCYTYAAGDERSRKRAKHKAHLQGAAMGERQLEYVEALIGRELREAERAVDVLGLDAKLNGEKDRLERAVEREKARAVMDYAHGGPGRLRATEEMRDCLRRLAAFGRREALAELRRLGYRQASAPFTPVGRAFQEATDFDDDLRPLFGRLDQLLGTLTLRLRDGAAEADLTEAAADAIARALLTVPGARDVASRLVSTGLTSGLGATFEENEGLVTGWEYSAVLDAGLCGACAPNDGKTYLTWAEAQIDLPNGGPHPYCFGDGRCRCRLVPLPAGASF